MKNAIATNPGKLAMKNPTTPALSWEDKENCNKVKDNREV